MTPGNISAPPASALACKKRRLVHSTMLTPEKKPKKAPGSAEALQDAFILKTVAPPLARGLKLLII
jgi:hypothetical protein